MTVQETITARVSRRSYLPTPLTPAERARLTALCEAISRAGGGRIELIENEQQVFSRFGKSYGLFSGVHSFFALIARKSDPDACEKLGFFGELLVLQATALGLGTCWVGGTYDARACPCTLDTDEQLCCVITVGACREKEGLKESFIHRFTRRGTKALEDFIDADESLPAWFLKGVQAVRLAPSAFNAQPVRLSLANGMVHASVPDMTRHRDLDLGIAKAHFALQTGGRWDWGNGALLYKDARGDYDTPLPTAIERLLLRQLPQESI